MVFHRNKYLASLVLLGTFVFALNFLSCSSSEKKKELARQQLTVEQQKEVIAEAYLYGYPLVLSGVQRDISTAVKKPGQNKAPLNQMANNRTLPTPSSAAKISLPNVNVLTSSAWIDVGNEPVVLLLPAAGNRYYVFELMNAWTDVFASLGPRTSGSGAANFVITGPSWHGNLPFNTREIKSATNNVWILGQIQVYGSGVSGGEINQARAFQNQVDLMPLSQYAKQFKAPLAALPSTEEVDSTTPAVQQVHDMDAKIFYASLAEEMKKNPPTSYDQKIVEQLRRVGLAPGESFVYSNLSPERKKIFDDGYQAGKQKLAEMAKTSRGQTVNGWMSLVSTGNGHNDYADRAFVARTSLGANLIDDVYYQWANVDQSGERLNGKNRYTLHFNTNQAPPTFGFWSLTVYDAKGNLIRNQLRRYSLSDHESISYHRDGSFDLYIQSTSPGGSLEANWLPTPRGEFQLMARLYWPKKNALNGSWKMPGIQKVQEVRKLSHNP